MTVPCLLCTSPFDPNPDHLPGRNSPYCRECLASPLPFAGRVSVGIVAGSDTAGYAGYNAGLGRVVADRDDWRRGVAEMRARGKTLASETEVRKPEPKGMPDRMRYEAVQQYKAAIRKQR